jgi:parvulin-like peptidyl-prolyl isomerase
MKRIALCVLLFVLCAVFGFSQSDLQPAAIVKLTKSEPITVKQFRTEVDRMEKTAGRTLNESEKKEVLDAMINERLALQAADRDKITITESEVNQQIQQLRDSLTQRAGRSVTEAEFAKAIKDETGLELPAFREQARRQLVVQKYLMSKKQNLFDNFKEPTEAEILEIYNLSRAQFVRPDTVRFSYVRIPYGADRVKAKELADRLYRDVGSNPSKFNEVAMKGQVANSGYQSGDGGYLPRMMEAQQLLGAEFVRTAFSLKPEEVSKLMESTTGQFRGYQFIKVTETYTMKNLELDDIYRLGVPMTVKDTIRYSLLQENQQKLLAQATEELVTELRAGGKTFEIFNRNLGW